MNPTPQPGTDTGRFEKLDQLIERYSATKAELTELKAAEAPLRADIDRRVAELGGLSPSHFVLTPKPGTLDKATEKALGELAVARGRLEILPGAIYDAQKRLAACGTEIVQLCDAEHRTLRKDARERLASERSEVAFHLSGKMIRDASRLNTAVASVVESSEANRWANQFPLAALPAEPLARAKCIRRCRAVFDGGGSLSSAFKG